MPSHVRKRGKTLCPYRGLNWAFIEIININILALFFFYSAIDFVVIKL